MLYLDHAATTPVRPEVREAMLPWLSADYGNASSRHEIGLRAADALAQARARVAAVLGVRRGDVIFTSGGTEANNLAVKGITLGRGEPGGLLVTTGIEHESVLASADYLRRWHGFRVLQVAVEPTGRVIPAALEEALAQRPTLVSIGYANNEVGTVQDVTGIIARVRAHGGILHVDAVQAAGWLDVSLAAGHALDGCAAVSLSGHKLGAPQGTGLLVARGRVPLEPVLHGGGQERGRRSGTESVAGAVALATALELAEAERVASARAAATVRDAFIHAVLATVPGASLTGDPAHRLPGSASFTFAGTSGEAVLLELERRGVVSSSGSACAAGRDDPSHVLRALGIADDLAQTAVRFTFPHRDLPDPQALAAAVAASVSAIRGTRHADSLRS